MISAHQLPAESESSRGREREREKERETEREIQRELELECGRVLGVGGRVAAVLRKCAAATVASVTV